MDALFYARLSIAADTPVGGHPLGADFDGTSRTSSFDTKRCLRSSLCSFQLAAGKNFTVSVATLLERNEGN